MYESRPLCVYNTKRNTNSFLLSISPHPTHKRTPPAASLPSRLQIRPPLPVDYLSHSRVSILLVWKRSTTLSIFAQTLQSVKQKSRCDQVTRRDLLLHF
ncbi:hypothetical protein L1987_30181 [Smallanthus sonchifolius]|uniref:Uncharacterized protein n=1 Tax=Smallanthus sonchifolius TaxID=185202 RepID=A0ACB9I1X3_9ASTR|nr:hypothetical protein L1987_30181 [Smallanthus sonchifolius]